MKKREPLMGLELTHDRHPSLQMHNRLRHAALCVWYISCTVTLYHKLEVCLPDNLLSVK